MHGKNETDPGLFGNRADVVSIKKGRFPGQSQVFAVKFIHKDFAMRHGRVSKKQLDLEISLHKYLGTHANIVQFFQSGEDVTWKWIAMELAEGGDLFDKIESDVGVNENIAHVYFTQIISAVTFMHSKGVGHRDIKPENILLSSDGNLKIADFGLATLFSYKNERKICRSSCGSPPYTAPEVVVCNAATVKAGQGYYGDLVDIWSCGVVLFVLLVGNTPWDEPRETSYEFSEYVRTSGRPDDELWHNLPAATLSLLRGMMRVDSASRFSLADVRKHPWYTRSNRHLRSDGKIADGLALATDMFENLRVDFTQDPLASQSQRLSQPQHASGSPDAMDVDSQPPATRLPSTQPITPTAELAFEWEPQPRLAASQLPDADAAIHAGYTAAPPPSSTLDDRLADDPALSQFAPSPAVPLSRTQFARRFADILPSHSLTRFVSRWPLASLLPPLVDALRRLNVPVTDLPAGWSDRDAVVIRVRTVDDRRCALGGEVAVESMRDVDGGVLCQVCFVKAKGDPVQWRRLFKRVVVLCEGAVWRPE